MADTNVGGVSTSGQSVSRGSTSFGGSKGTPTNSAVQAFTANGHQQQNQWGANDYVNFSNINLGGLTGLGMVLVQAAQAIIIQKQIELAEDYYHTNLVDFQFFDSTYKAKMTQHKDDAFTAPAYAVDYFPMTGASLGRVKVYDEKWAQTRRRLHRYNVGLGMHLDYSYYMGRRKATMTSFVAGRRIEDARKDWKDDQAHTHKVQALNFGITAGNIARQGLASATRQYESAYDDIGSRIGGFGNGLSRNAGYNAGREQGSHVLDAASTSGANMAPHTVGTGT